MIDPFVKSKEAYVRKIDPINQYLDLQGFYLSRMTDKPFDECRQWVRTQMSERRYPLKNPVVTYLSRENQSDRVETKTNLMKYIYDAVKLNHILVPTFTTYYNSKQRKSYYTTLIVDKKSSRKKHKKLSFKYKMEGDEDMAQFHDQIQNGKKKGVNSLSGAALQKTTISYTSTLHSTLTSVCRISTSYSNYNNEKLIMGRRHYSNYQLTLDNLCVLGFVADKDKIDECIATYNLKYPTVEETMACIKLSTDMYWYDPEALARIEAFVSKLHDYERANIVYAGDLYHLDIFNPAVIESYFKDMTNVALMADLNVKEVMDNADEAMIVYASYLCSASLAGMQLEKAKVDNPSAYNEVAQTVANLTNATTKWTKFIECFLAPEVLHLNVNNVYSLTRKTVLTSDTDSTIFTTQYWGKRFTGSYNFEPESYNAGYFITYLSGRTIKHQLAMMSANLGIETENIHLISMKSEYYFPVYVLTNSAKHYFNFISAQEGNVYKQLKLQVKGVELRNSKIPKVYVDELHEHMKHVMRCIIKDVSIGIRELFKPAIRQEREILSNLNENKTSMFVNESIKEPSSYKKDEDAPKIKATMFWNDTFGRKYGSSPDYPYTAYKLSLTLTNKRAIAEWLDKMADKQLARDIATAVAQYDKKDMKVLYVPALCVYNGLPEEIREVLDINKTIYDISFPWYLMLESFGFYLKRGNYSRLILNEFGHLMDDIKG